MAKFLVTGIAGFIGSAIGRALVQAGEEVVGVDNFSTGTRKNMSDIADRVDFHEADLADLRGIRKAFAGVEFVFHEAAIPSVPRSVADPICTNDSNITGTLNVLIAARDAGVKRVVYAGSSSAYGDQPTLPKREDMLPQPISPYAVSKLAGEMYMSTFHRCYGLETVTLRYFNVFGPRQDANSEYSAVLAKFITLMLAGEQPTIFGDGEQSRDFTYIDNIVNANLRACKAQADRVAGKVFNVATGSRITLNQTFAILKELTGYKGTVNYAAERAGDIKHSYADSSLAGKVFGYEPDVNFEEGLRRTVKWYADSMSAVAKSS